MNFETFRESLSSFARTAERLQALSESLSDSITPMPVGLFPPPRLEFLWNRKSYQLPSVEVFRTAQALCSHQRGVGYDQSFWNQESAAICDSLGQSLTRLISAFHSDKGRLEQAKKNLREMRGKLKESSRLNPRRQRRWNISSLAALNSLVKAHRNLGTSKLKRAGISEDIWKKLQSKIDKAVKCNSRATHGLRRFMGRFALDQRQINNECFNVLHELCRLHAKLNVVLQKQTDQNGIHMMQDAMQLWLAQNTSAIIAQMEAQRAASHEKFKKLQTTVATLGSRIRSLEDGTFHLPHLGGNSRTDLPHHR